MAIGVFMDAFHLSAGGRRGRQAASDLGKILAKPAAGIKFLARRRISGRGPYGSQ